MRTLTNITALALAAFCGGGISSAHATELGRVPFGDWVLLREKNGLGEECVAATAREGREARVILDGATTIIAFKMDREVPEGKHTIALSVDAHLSLHLVAKAVGPTIITALPQNDAGARILKEMIDGKELSLRSSFGHVMATFSLNGSGKAFVGTLNCHKGQG